MLSIFLFFHSLHDGFSECRDSVGYFTIVYKLCWLDWDFKKIVQSGLLKDIEHTLNIYKNDNLIVLSYKLLFVYI